MNHLILILSPAVGDCLTQGIWLYCDEHGRLLRSGQGGVETWPAGVRTCHLLLGGTAVSCHLAPLPRAVRARLPEVMAGVLEEVLLESVDTLSFACSGKEDAQGRYPVAVVDTGLLRQVLAALHERGVAVLSAWPLGAVLAGGESLSVAGEHTLAVAEGGFLGCEQDEELGTLAGVAVSVVPSQAMLAERHHPLGMQAGWLYGALQPSIRARPRQADWQPVRRLAGVLAGVLVLLVLIQTGWMKWQATQFMAEITQSFREIVPHEPMVDPLRQSERVLAGVRRQAGQASPEDFLSLLAAWRDYRPGVDGAVREILYETGRLTVIGTFSAEQTERLRAQLERRALQVEILPAAGGGQRILIMPGGGR